MALLGTFDREQNREFLLARKTLRHRAVYGNTSPRMNIDFNIVVREDSMLERAHTNRLLP
jgi:hypothetical protein